MMNKAIIEAEKAYPEPVLTDFPDTDKGYDDYIYAKLEHTIRNSVYAEGYDKGATDLIEMATDWLGERSDVILGDFRKAMEDRLLKPENYEN